MIRASTVRKNIQYQVIDGGAHQAEQDATLEQIVTTFLQRDPSGKALIMCNSRPGVERVAASGMFPCEYYHAKLPSGAKKELLDDFRAGQFRVIVATGAFGTGIDIDDIHLVVHVDEPWDMMDYGQTSGRGGRDGQSTQAIIIRGGIPSTDPLIQ